MSRILVFITLFCAVGCSNVLPHSYGYSAEKNYRVVFVRPGDNKKENRKEILEKASNKKSEPITKSVNKPIVQVTKPVKKKTKIVKRKKRRKVFTGREITIRAAKSRSEYVSLGELPIVEPEIEIIQHQQSSIERKNYNSKRNYRSPRGSRNNFISRSTYRFGNQQLDFPQEHLNIWIEQFGRKSRSRFLRFYKNGQSYKKIITSVFRKYNLPTDLYYVGFIESGYNKSAQSHADAVGPWQFIKSTAQRYGLRVDRSVDERRNIYKSTEAAARYFKDLYNIFGSWDLAMSAYNAGEYRIINAIKSGNTRNFRELVKRNLLPKETVHYVPKVMAAKHLHNRAKEFGISFPKLKPSVYESYVTTKIHYPFSLKAIAEGAHIPYSLLKSLNSDVNHKWTYVSHKRPHTLYLPKGYGKGRIYSKLTSSKPSGKVLSSLQKYEVQAGDSLLAIAYKFDVSLSELKRVNKLKSNLISKGQKLSIPSVKKNKIHVVQSGESIFNIAKKYDVSLSEILQANDLDSSKIYPGQKILVPQDI